MDGTPITSLASVPTPIKQGVKAMPAKQHPVHKTAQAMADKVNTKHAK